MKFAEAMKNLEEGKKVRLKSWPKEKYISLRDNEVNDEYNKPVSLGSCFNYEWELYTDKVYISTLKEGDYFEYYNLRYRIIPKWMLEHVVLKPEGFTIPAIRCYEDKYILTCFTPCCIVIKL